MSMSSVRKLLNKSLSTSKHHLTHSKPSSLPSKSHFPNTENSPPVHHNIQHHSPIHSPLKPISSKDVGFCGPSPSPSPLGELSSAHDPPVKVLVRIRPKTVNEDSGDPSIKKIDDVSLNVGDRHFEFDSVLDSNSKQEDVYKFVGAPLVKDALAGFNASVLSYGQTGTGKTYAMWGLPSAMVEGQSLSNDQGLVPRFFQKLFAEIEREKENLGDNQRNYQCRCSFLEIYNGQIGDILDPTPQVLQMKDDAKKGFYIENLTEEYVTCYDDVTQILIKGLSNRKIGATSINSESSRSHIVFTCVIESWCKETSSNNSSCSKTSRISFVDLAELGRHKEADAGREFERERKEINNSLSHLGHLVNILAAGTQPDVSIYKDSSLTHLLQQSLGGNAKLAVICTISPDIKDYVETLSTLRFGQRIRSVQNKPVINEITDEDMDDLTDQIRQLKEELIRAKLNDNSSEPGNRPLTGRSIRESVNQLRIGLNRSLMLPSTGNGILEDISTNESDVTELCKHLNKLDTSCEENLKDHSFDNASLNFASVQGSNDSYFSNEHESNCLHEPALALSDSPKITNLQRNSIIDSSITKSTTAVSRSVRENESSLRSSKLFSGPPESLAASLKRGLDIIHSNQKIFLSNKDSESFSFEHLMLKPSPPPPFMCISCRQKGENGLNGAEDGLKSWVLNVKNEGGADTAEGEKDLEKICNEQAARIKELNHLVEQLRNEKQKDYAVEAYKGTEDKGCEDDESFEPEVIKSTYVNIHKSRNGSFDMKEKEELLMEIQSLKNKLHAYTNPAPNKSIDKLRSSLLSRSMHIRKSMMSSQFNNAEELEKERERWTEMESEWINLTDELRIDIECHRQNTENVNIKLEQEKKHREELDDALERAVVGHTRFVELYVELEEKYNSLCESHKRVMETITDVKRAAAKAGEKGGGARYAKAFAGELTAIRAEEKRERERLIRENKTLRTQLRETADALQTAGELLVRLREAEETASFAESNMTELQQENEELKKQVEKMNSKHRAEMVTIKQYMAETKLPESALKPVHFDEEPLHTPHDDEEFLPNPHDDDEAWRSEFGDIFQHHHY